MTARVVLLPELEAPVAPADVLDEVELDDVAVVAVVPDVSLLEPLVVEPLLTDAAFAAEATDAVPDAWPIVIAPAKEAKAATLSAVTATRVRTPCLRRRLRRASGASAAVPRRACSRRIRSACSSGLISLMSGSVPSAIPCDPMIGSPP